MFCFHRSGLLGLRIDFSVVAAFFRLRDNSALLAQPFGAVQCFVSITAAFWGRALHLFVVTAFLGHVTILLCWHGVSGPHDVCLPPRPIGAAHCSYLLSWLFRAT